MNYFEESKLLNPFKALVLGTAGPEERSKLSVEAAFENTESIECIFGIRLNLVQAYEVCSETLELYYPISQFQKDVDVLLGPNAVVEVPSHDGARGSISTGARGIKSVTISEGSSILYFQQQLESQQPSWMETMTTSCCKNGFRFPLAIRFAELMFSLSLYAKLQEKRERAASCNPFVETIIPQQQFSNWANKVLLNWRSPISHFQSADQLLTRAIETQSKARGSDLLNESELRKNESDKLVDFLLENVHAVGDYTTVAELRSYVDEELSDLNYADFRQSVKQKKNEIENQVMKHELRQHYASYNGALDSYYPAEKFERDLGSIDQKLNNERYGSRLASIRTRIVQISEPIARFTENEAAEAEKQSLKMQEEISVANRIRLQEQEESKASRKIADLLDKSRKASDTDADIEKRHDQLLSEWRKNRQGN